MWQTSFFVYFQTDLCKLNKEAVKNKFEIDKITNLSNLIFQSRDFKNQVWKIKYSLIGEVLIFVWFSVSIFQINKFREFQVMKSTGKGFYNIKVLQLRYQSEDTNKERLQNKKVKIWSNLLLATLIVFW